MLAPMRPSSTIPICMSYLLAPWCWSNRPVAFARTDGSGSLGSFQKVLQAHPEDAPIMVLQGQIVARRLGLEELAEAVVPAGDGNVRLGVVHDLHEHAVCVTAFVQLAGRVQVAGAKPESGRHPTLVAYGDARLLQGLDLRVVVDVHIGLDREIVVFLQGLECIFCGRVREVRGAFIEYRRGRLLGGLDVSLIAGVDTEDVSSHRDRELPAEALRPHAVTIHV